MDSEKANVLIAEDNEVNRKLLSRILKSLGHSVGEAENGRQALDMVYSKDYDLMLLDIMMPEMTGFEVLGHIKARPDLRHIPIVVISAISDLSSTIRCIELGAEDYTHKPFNRVLLEARINALLEKKRVNDQQVELVKELQAERQKSERLLLNVLPLTIADRLKNGGSLIADRFDEVTVLFADLVDFTKAWDQKPPLAMVKLLNEIFSCFDQLAQKHGLEKIKTLGDAYMVVGGLPAPRQDHAEAVAGMALDILKEIAQFPNENGEPYRMRIGIDTGPVVAGVIGKQKFSYDLWGDTVNTASRMQTHGLINRIQVTSSTYECLRNKFQFRKRGVIQVKGKGKVLTYLLKGRKSSAA